ncbi:MAG: extracellular solute-binding protein [Armatimonadetes bacterium]|nr:extracellular solute-binding protein [Armatimonadota bacterium]
MKAVFWGIFAGLALLSVAAWRMQPSPAESGKVPLVWVSDDNPARREQMALFNRTNPHSDLKLDPNNTGMEKVIVQSLAGVGPDLFDCYNAFQLSAYVRSGIAWDVTARFRELEATDPEAHLKLEDMWAAVHPNILHEGRIYGFPTNAATNAVWFNKDIFDRYRVPYPKGPWTWEQFLKIAKRLTIRDGKGRVKVFGLLMNWDWYLGVIQWGGRLYTPDGTRCIADSPQAAAGLQFLQDLIYKYRVTPSPAQEAALASQGGWGTGTITFFGAGKSAMAIGGRWWLCLTREQYKSLRLGAAEAPHGPYRVHVGYGRATLINAKSPRREAALKFLLYMSKQPYNDLINHQADALAPVKAFCYTPQYLRDPAYPQEDFNAVWRDVMRYGRVQETSPFINGQTAERILTVQTDLVRSGQKTAAAALKTAAEKINAEILKTLERDPGLKERYLKLTRRKAAPR